MAYPGLGYFPYQECFKGSHLSMHFDTVHSIAEPSICLMWPTYQLCRLLVCCLVLFFLLDGFSEFLTWGWVGGTGCEVSCGGHHRQRGKTTSGSALVGAVLDFTQILAYIVHNMSISQLYLGFGHFGWLPSFSVNNILVGLWLNCISSVEITLFLLADIIAA